MHIWLLSIRPRHWCMTVYCVYTVDGENSYFRLCVVDLLSSIYMLKKINKTNFKVASVYSPQNESSNLNNEMFYIYLLVIFYWAEVLALYTQNVINKKENFSFYFGSLTRSVQYTIFFLMLSFSWPAILFHKKHVHHLYSR